MSVSMKSKGFTLVEMLVVIAIIAILAASLFPKIKDAMNSARATSLMTKGRGIYNAVITANAAREPHGMPSVWPTYVDKSVKGDAVKYFTYLMSNDEEGKYGEIAEEGERIASDISPDSFFANGMKVFTTDFGSDQCAWNVCEVDDGMPSGLPFLITKNYQDKTIDNKSDDNKKLTLNDIDPFKKSLAVWITVGGSAQKAESVYFRNSVVMNHSKTNITVWVCAPTK